MKLLRGTIYMYDIWWTYQVNLVWTWAIHLNKNYAAVKLTFSSPKLRPLNLAVKRLACVFFQHPVFFGFILSKREMVSILTHASFLRLPDFSPQSWIVGVSQALIMLRASLKQLFFVRKKKVSESLSPKKTPWPFMHGNDTMWIWPFLNKVLIGLQPSSNKKKVFQSLPSSRGRKNNSQA